MLIDTMTVNDEDGNEFELSKAEFEAEMVGELAFLLTDIYSDASLLELVYLNGWTAQYQMEGNWMERGCAYDDAPEYVKTFITRELLDSEEYQNDDLS